MILPGTLYCRALTDIPSAERTFSFFEESGRVACWVSASTGMLCPTFSGTILDGKPSNGDSVALVPTSFDLARRCSKMFLERSDEGASALNA